MRCHATQPREPNVASLATRTTDNYQPNRKRNCQVSSILQKPDLPGFSIYQRALRVKWAERPILVQLRSRNTDCRSLWRIWATFSSNAEKGPPQSGHLPKRCRSTKDSRPPPWELPGLQPQTTNGRALHPGRHGLGARSIRTQSTSRPVQYRCHRHQPGRRLGPLACGRHFRRRGEHLGVEARKLGVAV